MDRQREPAAGDASMPSCVRLAARVDRLPPYMFGRINSLLYQKRRAGHDVIDLGMGNPSDPPEPRVTAKLMEAARDPRNHGYSKSNGILNLRREVASKYLTHFGVRLDPDCEAMVCLGSKEGFSHMCLALVGAGDTAIIPAPYFPVHMYAVALAAGNVIALEVRDREKFLSNIAYTCEHLYPRAQIAHPQLSSQSDHSDGGTRVLRGRRPPGETLWAHGHQRLRLCRRGLRRLPPSELPGGPRCH